jgi:hypothetical protein
MKRVLFVWSLVVVASLAILAQDVLACGHHRRARRRAARCESGCAAAYCTTTCTTSCCEPSAGAWAPAVVPTQPPPVVWPQKTTDVPPVRERIPEPPRGGT